MSVLSGLSNAVVVGLHHHIQLPSNSINDYKLLTSLSLFFFARFFDLFEKCDGYKSGKLKLKKPKQLQASFVVVICFCVY